MATFGGPRIDGIVAPSSQSKTTVKTGYSGANDPYAAGYTAAKQAFAGGANTTTAGNAALKATLTDPNYSAPLVAQPSGVTSPLGSANSLSDAQIIAQREQNLRDFQSGALGGGGGTTTSTTRTNETQSTPQTPAGPAAAGGGSAGAASALAGFTEDEIAAALAGLEAQFGMTRAQLLADQTQAGAQYRLLLAQLERGRVQGIETATNDAVRRGIYRSGILGENIADVEASALGQRDVAEQELQARTQANESQLRNLDAMQAAQAAQIEAGLRRQYANTMLEAGLNPGAVQSGGVAPQGVVPGAGAAPAAAPVVNTQGVVGAGAPPSNTLTTTVARQQTQSEEEAYRQRLAEMIAMQQAYPYRPPVDYSQWQAPAPYNPGGYPQQQIVGGGLRVL